MTEITIPTPITPISLSTLILGAHPITKIKISQMNCVTSTVSAPLQHANRPETFT